MQLRLLVSLISIISISALGLSQECCKDEIIKLEKKLSRKYDSFERINSIPKDGKINSMGEVFYLVHKKKKHGILDGNRSLIYATYWDDVELLLTRDPAKKYIFFRYRIDGKEGIGSVENGLHLPPEFERVSIQIVDDSNTICLIGEKNNHTRIDWMKRGNNLWISKSMNFNLERINIYRRASTVRYGRYDDLVFFNGASKAVSFELKSGKPGVSGPIRYTNTVLVDAIESPALLCLNHESGFYQLMSPDKNNELKTLYTYNDIIVSGHTIEGGLIIAKTQSGHYKLPLSKFAEDFQKESYDKLYHSDQNLFLVKNSQLVVVNRQGSHRVVIRNYFEPDYCGNYHPEIHITEENESFSGQPIRSLEGSLFVTRNGQLLIDDQYLMSILDKKRCLYLIWEDELREGIMGKSSPKNKRGLIDAKGNLLFPPVYSAIWKKGDYFLTLKGGKVSSMILTPTLYSGGEWILYDKNFNQIGSSVQGAEFREGGVIEKNGFTIDDTFYSTFDFTQKYFGIGVYEP